MTIERMYTRQFEGDKIVLNRVGLRFSVVSSGTHNAVLEFDELRTAYRAYNHLFTPVLPTVADAAAVC